MRTIDVNAVLEGISAPSIRFDVNASNELIGIEILSFGSDRSILGKSANSVAQ